MNKKASVFIPKNRKNQSETESQSSTRRIVYPSYLEKFLHSPEFQAEYKEIPDLKPSPDELSLAILGLPIFEEPEIAATSTLNRKARSFAPKSKKTEEKAQESSVAKTEEAKVEPVEKKAVPTKLRKFSKDYKPGSKKKDTPEKKEEEAKEEEKPAKPEPVKSA